MSVNSLQSRLFEIKEAVLHCEKLMGKRRGTEKQQKNPTCFDHRKKFQFAKLQKELFKAVMNFGQTFPMCKYLS